MAVQVKRKILGKIFASAAFILISLPAAAETYVITGVGASNDSCGHWLQARRGNKTLIQGIFMAWSQGYLAGRNLDKGLPIPEPAVIESILDKECAADPLKPIWVASETLWQRLATQNGVDAMTGEKKR